MFMRQKQNNQAIALIAGLALFGLSGYGLFLFGKTTSSASGLAQGMPPNPQPTPQIVVEPQSVRALPGQLDAVPMFNSNSPEWVKTEGVLLSTLPPIGKKTPTAHLNFPFQGRFDLFVHHQTHTPKDLQTFYLSVLLYNPSTQPVAVDVLQGATYLTQSAPYIKLPTYVDNPNNSVYAGPGDRVATDILQGK